MVLFNRTYRQNHNNNQRLWTMLNSGLKPTDRAFSTRSPSITRVQGRLHGRLQRSATNTSPKLIVSPADLPLTSCTTKTPARKTFHQLSVTATRTLASQYEIQLMVDHNFPSPNIKKRQLKRSSIHP